MSASRHQLYAVARLARGALLVSVLAGVMACTPAARRTKSAAPPPSASQASAPRSQNNASNTGPQRPGPVDKWLALNRELGDSIAAAGQDCSRVATAVTIFTRSHGRMMSNLNAVVLDWERQTPRRTVSRLYAEARPHIDRRVDAAIRCDKRPDARQAFDAYLKATGLDTR